MQRKKLILDLDAGIDDAFALAYALGSPEVELIGITATFGNVDVERSARNCLDVLDLLGHPEVPVFIGASRAYHEAEHYQGAPQVHGGDGLGGVRLPRSTREPRRAAGADGEAAVAFIVEAARRLGPDLIYVPTGPLTNLARALDRDADAVRSLGRVTFMGGALTVPGNRDGVAESNIFADPEGAARVLSAGLPHTMVGLDVTHRAVWTRERVQAWRALGTPAAVAFADMAAFYLDAYAHRDPWLGGCPLHDPLAVAAALDPALITTLPLELTVVTAGAERGRTVADEERTLTAPIGSAAAVDVDAETFVERFARRTSAVLAP